MGASTCFDTDKISFYEIYKRKKDELRFSERASTTRKFGKQSSFPLKVLKGENFHLCLFT